MEKNKKNSIIFLDCDSVICLSSNWGGRIKKWAKYRSSNPESSKFFNDAPVGVRFDDFDKKAIDVLNEILEETGVEIVVSSDWRYYATLEELGEYFSSQGIIKKPIDITPQTKDIDPKWWDAFNSGGSPIENERVIEIKCWLEQHPEVTHWVAIDDLNLGIYEPISGDIFNENGLINFVHTRKPNKGIKQSGIKEKILKYLK
jgi:hypothetical protein